MKTLCRLCFTNVSNIDVHVAHCATKNEEEREAYRLTRTFFVPGLRSYRKGSVKRRKEEQPAQGSQFADVYIHPARRHDALVESKYGTVSIHREYPIDLDEEREDIEREVGEQLAMRQYDPARFRKHRLGPPLRRKYG